MDMMTRTEAHREFRPYTKSSVFRQQLSAAQVLLLEQAGHGGVIRAGGKVTWLSLRSMADKGAVEIIERVIRQGPHGPINGKILAVRVR